MADEKKTSYILEAADRFSGVFNDFRKQLNGIGNDTASLRSQLSNLDGAVSSLGISWRALFGLMATGGTVAGFGAVIKGAIDAEAHLADLSKSTGMSVESLSALMPAAKAAGTSMDDVALASEKLSKSMVQSQDPHSKAAAAFKFLGLSATDAAGHLKDPNQMMLELAQKLETFKDGAGKSAIAMDTMGRSGAQALPFMHELAVQGELHAKVTSEQAEQAKLYEKQLGTLSAASGALARDMANKLLPALNDILKAFMDGRKEAGLYQGAIAGMSALFEQIGGNGHEQRVKELADINAQIAAIKIWQESTISATVTDSTRAANDQKILDLTNRKRQLTILLAGDEKAAADQAAAFAAAAATNAKKDLDYKGQAGDLEAKIFETTKANLEKRIALLEGATKEEQFLWTLQEAKFASLTPKQKQELIDLDHRADLIERNREETDAYNKVLDELDKHEQARVDRAVTLVNGLQDQNEQYKLETDSLGKSNTERALGVSHLEREKALRGQDNEQIIEAINREYDERDALIAVRGEREMQLSLWNQLADAGASMFSQMETSGKNAMDVLRSSLKSLVSDLIQVFARRWILQLGASAMGSTALGAAASNSGAGSIGGSLLSSGGSAGLNLAGGSPMFGSFISGAGTGIGGAFGTGALTAGGDFVGTGLAGMAGNVALAAGATDAFAATIAAAIPVIGWVVAIGAVLYAIFGSKGGAPKGGGSFMGAFDSATGSLMGGSSAVPGTDNGRFFTPSQADPQMQQFATSIGSGFASTLKALGGTSGNLSFGFGFDTDPHGTANNRVSGMVLDADGKPIFDQHDLDAGRDDQGLQSAIGLEGQRAILAGLQHSEFPKAIADILNSIVAESASADDIQKVLSAATEMKAVLDALPQLNIKGLDITALQAMQHSGESIGQTFQRVAGELQNFDNAFTTDTQKLVAAHTTVDSTFQSLGIAVPATSQDFYDLVHGLDLSTESGRHMFDMLMAVAPAFQSVEQAGNAMISTFNQIMGSLRGNAFTKNLLQGQMDADLDQFRQKNAWARDLTLQQLLGALLTITPEDFANYVRDKPDSAALINAILGLYSTIQSLNDNGAGPIPTLNNTIIDTGNAAAAAADALKSAKDALGSYLDSLLTNPSLSPLSPQEQLGAARQSFLNLLKKAQGGDVNAIQGLQGSADTYLNLARSAFGSSSDYVNIFNEVFNDLAKIAGTPDINTRMATIQQGILDQAKAQSARLDQVVALLIGIRDNQPAAAATVAGAVADSGATVANSVNNNPLVRA